jgi:exosortase
MVSRTDTPPAGLWAQLPWLVLFCVAFAPTLAWLFDRWTLNIYYNGHGLFVPVIVAYLMRENFREHPLRQVDSSPWGLVFLAVGLGLLVFDSTLHTELLAAIGLVVCLPGISLLLLGAERTRSLAFPLLISWFMLPIPAGAISELHLALRRISAVGAEQLVGLWGIPVLREDTTMMLPNAMVEVADSCSGVSTLIASLLLGLILAHMTPGWARKLGLMVAAVVFAVIANTIRVAILTLIVHYYGIDPLKTALHEISGMITFGVVLAALFSISGRRTPGEATA